MRSSLNILVAAAAAILVVPQFATAETDVEEQLRQMNARMSRVADQLQAAQDELDASTETAERQGEVIEKAGLDRQAQSGLSSFYDKVQISGWMAASWFFNTRSPGSAAIWDQNDYPGTPQGGNTGYNGYTAPFHPDHNSFSVDQLWFEIEKPVTEESRGGFRADLVWGNLGNFLDPQHSRDNRDEASGFVLYQAYAQYLTPWGPTVKAGKFGTIIGYEVAGTVYNFNITRGLVYTALQPITQYGVLVDGQTDGGLVYGLGVINGSGQQGAVYNEAPDINNSKSILARLGWAGEKASVLANLMWGNQQVAGDSDPFITVDMVATFDPTESFSTWLNFTWQQRMNTKTYTGPLGTQNDPPAGNGQSEGWGIAAAGRYAFTDRLGLALRGEYIADNRGLFHAEDTAGLATDIDAWAATITGDFAITDDLTLKAEARYDWMDFQSGAHSNNFFKSGTNQEGITNTDNYRNDDQWLTGLEIVYQF